MTSDPPDGEPVGKQLLLDFPRIDAADRPLIETEPYRGALAAIRRWRNWPGGQLALAGDAFAGKTRLLHLWAADVGAALVTGPALAAAGIDDISSLSIAALAVDDADRCGDGRAMLAAINLCRDRNAPILLAGAGEPATWFTDPPDLRSRMRAMPAVAIEPPDEASLALRLIEECARRFLVLPADSAAYIAERMERSWAAVGRLADHIEQTPGRASSLRYARNMLISLGMDVG